jgi:hypothetical protein
MPNETARTGAYPIRYARRLAVAAIHISKSHGTSIRANPGDPLLGHVYPCESVSIRGLFPFVRQEKWATDGHGFTRIQIDSYGARTLATICSQFYAAHPLLKERDIAEAVLVCRHVCRIISECGSIF